MEAGTVKFALSSGQPVVVQVDLNDNAWHNISLLATNTNVSIVIDNDAALAQSRVQTSVLAFDSLEIDSMTLGGISLLPDGRSLTGGKVFC